MKRVGNLYPGIVTIDNLYIASRKAQKGKTGKKEVKEWNSNLLENLWELKEDLLNRTYTIGIPRNFTIYEPKERQISALPFRDRVVHHALIQKVEKVIQDSLIAQTYSCIRKRGIHKLLEDLNTALRGRETTKYCLKLDIRKFYPSVDNEILKEIIRRKFKDPDLLWLLDKIIDNSVGLPLGSYTSQWLGNMYLNEFNHWLKQTKRLKNVFVYCDDICILHPDKEYLFHLKHEIISFLRVTRKLELSNYQVFPVAKRAIDMVGYVNNHDGIWLRNSIKNNFKRMLKTNPNLQSINSYLGWTKHANCRHLEYKLLYENTKSN